MLTAFVFSAALASTAAPRTVEPLSRWMTNGPNAGISSVVVDPAHPGTVYAATVELGARFFMSVDDGRTWTEITGNYPRDPWQARLAVDPSSGWVYAWRGECFGSLCYCCSGDIRRRSADGTGWDLVYGAAAAISYLSIDANQPPTLYATQSTLIPPPDLRSDASAIRSRDGGRLWRPLGGPSEPSAILPDPTQPFRVYAIDAVTGFSVSSDRGDTWVAANGGLTDRFVTTAAVDPLLGFVVYAATPTGVFRTDSAGESWELTSLRLPTTAFAFDTSSPGVVYAGTDAGLFRTSDGGATWAPLPGLTGILTLALDPERGYLHAGTVAGVFELDLRARSPRTLEAR